MNLNPAQVKKMVGQTIYAVKKDGTRLSGKLVRVKGNQLYIRSAADGKVRTSAIIPLVLFDLLAIGTGPYAYGYPYGGVPGYNYYGGAYGGGYGYPGGYPGFFY